MMRYFPILRERGFTLIETLVAISFLSVAIVAPMTLVALSLAGAVQARDTITAYNLAQEGIEAVRSIRDGNIIHNARIGQTGTPRDLLEGFVQEGSAFVFIIDAGNNQITECSGACAKLRVHRTSPELYSYSMSADWVPTKFTRTMRAEYVDNPVSETDEVRLTSRVSWETNTGKPRSFTITEHLYRWIDDGSASAQ